MADQSDPPSGSTRREWLTGVSAAMSASSAASAQTGGNHWLQAYNRPILCTEYMARPNKSTFQGILPVAKKYKVAAYNWGFANGKTQTNLPWDSWQKPYTDREPAMWFHDIFSFEGKPYRPEEVQFIKQMTGGKGKHNK